MAEDSGERISQVPDASAMAEPESPWKALHAIGEMKLYEGQVD
jgi:hypothetical protein